MKNKISDREKEILEVKAKGCNPMMITSNSIDSTGKQKKSWLSPILAKNTDVLPSTEESLRTYKKRDVVDFGHKNEEITEILESQLSNGKNKRYDGEIMDIQEIQLGRNRHDDDIVEILTEGQLENGDHWNSATWEGDDIKIYRDINARQKQNAELNEEFYKDNPELTKGGKGVVSANKKMAQSYQQNYGVDAGQGDLEDILNDLNSVQQKITTLANSFGTYNSVFNNSVTKLEEVKNDLSTNLIEVIQNITEQNQNSSGNNSSQQGY